MTLLADKDERFKKLFNKIAAFLLAAAIGMALAFWSVGEKKGVFTAKSRIYFVADSGQDLIVGMPVKFSGFKIGKLNSLALDEQGQVQVEVDIETKYLKLIRQDSIMNLKREGVIGNGVLEVSRGSDDKPVLKPAASLRFERAGGLEQALVDMKDRILPIADDLHQILHSPDSDLRQTLKNLRELSAEMRGTRERIDHVLNSIDSNFNKEVPPLLHSLRQSSLNAEKLSSRLDRELPALLNKADSSMENLHLTSEMIKDAVQHSAPSLSGALAEARETLSKSRETLEDTQEVVDSLSTRWPLTNLVPKPETAPVKMDSHD